MSYLFIYIVICNFRYFLLFVILHWVAHYTYVGTYLQLLTMSVENLATKTLLHPLRSAKARNGVVIKTPPPLTFQKTPPPGPGMHKIIHQCAVADSSMVADVRKSYKHEKVLKLTQVIFATNVRMVRHTWVRCHHLDRGETKVYPGELATPDEVRQLGRQGYIEQGLVTDESTWVKKGTHVRPMTSTFQRVPQCSAKALNMIVHAIGRLNIGEPGTDSPWE